jgi:hypothetical protein
VNKLFKALIVWLMLAAIPFQGFAAASMLACVPAQTVVHAHMNMAPEHCATMGAMQSHAAGDTNHSSTHHQAGAKCSTCASCCCVAALAPPGPLTRAPNETSAAIAFHADDSAAARVDLALPERPPKHFADFT